VGGLDDRYGGISYLGRVYGANCPGYPTLVNKGDSGSAGRGDSALAIAKERYARGEISKEEFDQIKRDLS
jgi:hypothetical protein